jgi:uncharacterized protein YjbJ (UPF0337 family)
MPARKRRFASNHSMEAQGQVKEDAGEILDDELHRQGTEEQKAAKVMRVVGQWVSGAKQARPTPRSSRK